MRFNILKFKLKNIKATCKYQYAFDWSELREESVVRKIAIALLLIVLTLSGCKNNLNIRIGDSMTAINDQQTPFIILNSLSVFRTNNTYTVVVEENGTVQKLVEFSSDRKCRTVYGLVLVKNEDLNRYLDKSLNELKEKLGEVHADIGSGFYIPAYITRMDILFVLKLKMILFMKL